MPCIYRHAHARWYLVRSYLWHTICRIFATLERFGGYISHLFMIANDPKAKSSDRQKMKGYILKWQDSKVLIRCAFFLDLLRPAPKLCKVLRESEVCYRRTPQNLTSQ